MSAATKFLFASLVALATSACTSVPRLVSECPARHAQSSNVRMERTEVDLLPMPQEPVFYLAADHYAVLMPPARVTELLRSWVKSGTSTSNEMLLEAIVADLPLTADTDLRKYSIRRTRFDFGLPHIAAALLHEGHATVIDLRQMDHEKEISKVIVASVYGSLGEGRHFCTPDGGTILKVTDMIVWNDSPNNRLQPTLAKPRAPEA